MGGGGGGMGWDGMGWDWMGLGYANITRKVNVYLRY